MQLTQLVRDEEAVSEVIGVILMVAITVILAAVIAAVVLGIGGETQTTPQASFSWDWNAASGGSPAKLTITHDSGEAIKTTELFVRGDASSGNTLSASADNSWETLGGAASSSIGSTSAVASGDSVTICSGVGTGCDSNDGNLGSTYDLRVVWQPAGGETSATLAEDTGPDA